MQGTALVYFIFLWCFIFLCCLGTSCWGGLNPQRSSRAPVPDPALISGSGAANGHCGVWSRRDWVSEPPRLCKCPGRSAWMGQKGAQICSLLPVEALRRKAMAPSSVVGARPHQQQHTSLSKSCQLDVPHASEAEKTFPIYHQHIPNFFLHLELGLSFALWRRKFWSFGALIFEYIFGISVSKPGNPVKNLFFTSGISYCSHGIW